MTSADLDNDAHIQKRRIVDKVVVYVKRDPDLDDIQSSNEDNIEYIKHDVKEMIDYSGNTTEYHADGTIEITPNYLKPIPNEIIEIIIEYLVDYHKTQQNQRPEQRDFYELTLVSKQFYYQTNPLLWHTPFIYDADILQRFQNCLNMTRLKQPFTNIHYGLEDSTLYIPHNIIMSRHHVRGLVLDGDHWDDVQFLLMMPHLSLLEELTITNVGHHITASSLIHFPRYLPHLTLLSLRVRHVNQHCIDAIAQHCYQIGDLELPFNHLLPGTFKTLAENDSCITNLQSLRFYYMDSSPRRVEYDFLHADMIKDMARFNCLTELSFTGFKCASPLSLVWTATTSNGTAAWPLLGYFSMDNGNGLDEPSFISFIKSHPSLGYIYLGRSRISDSTLDAIADHLPILGELVVLHNNNITANAVYRLVQRCRYLKDTDFDGCTTLFSLAPELYKYKPYFTDAELANIRRHGDQ